VQDSVPTPDAQHTRDDQLLPHIFARYRAI